jgi:hypothetical protein
MARAIRIENDCSTAFPHEKIALLDVRSPNVNERTVPLARLAGYTGGRAWNEGYGNSTRSADFGCTTAASPPFQRH